MRGDREMFCETVLSRLPARRNQEDGHIDNVRSGRNSGEVAQNTIAAVATDRSQILMGGCNQDEGTN